MSRTCRDFVAARSWDRVFASRADTGRIEVSESFVLPVRPSAQRRAVAHCPAVRRFGPIDGRLPARFPASPAASEIAAPGSSSHHADDPTSVVDHASTRTSEKRTSQVRRGVDAALPLGSSRPSRCDSQLWRARHKCLLPCRTSPLVSRRRPPGSTIVPVLVIAVCVKVRGPFAAAGIVAPADIPPRRRSMLLIDRRGLRLALRWWLMFHCRLPFV